MTEPGVMFEVVWHDEDLLEFRVTAASSTFCGETKVYVGQGEAIAFARDLAGFPTSMADSRKFEFQSSAAGNRISLLFAPRGLHVDVVDVDDSGQSAHVVITVEAAALDTFIRHFRTIAQRRSGSAFLTGR